MANSKILILTAALFLSLPALAKPSCPQVYDAASHKFLSRMDELQGSATAAGVVGWVSAAGAAICFVTAPSIVGCVAGGALSGLAFLYQNANVNELERLEKAYKLYQVYLNHKDGITEVSEDVQEILQKLGLDMRGLDVSGEVYRLIESGTLCRRGKVRL